MILGTNGCNCMSMSCEIFSVGPPQPLTIGLTAIGFLWIFFQKVQLLRARHIFRFEAEVISGYVIYDAFLCICET